VVILQERTYADLLGTLDGNKTTVYAECLFADPVADIAVLGAPDDQALYEEAEAFDALIDNVPGLRISSNLTDNGWVLTLDREWVRIPLHVHSSLFGTSLSIGFTKPGMSGSPILNNVGRAVGVIAIGNGTEKQGPQPILSRNLPIWVLKGKKGVRHGLAPQFKTEAEEGKR